MARIEEQKPIPVEQKTAMQPTEKIVEVEITLQLINEKLNYVIGLLQQKV